MTDSFGCVPRITHGCWIINMPRKCIYATTLIRFNDPFPDVYEFNTINIFGLFFTTYVPAMHGREFATYFFHIRFSRNVYPVNSICVSFLMSEHYAFIRKLQQVGKQCFGLRGGMLINQFLRL